MFLKALEMQGFKSFPDKTVLEFGGGITGVVGPNGSGKSNISDAVRWVLGEQSTKSLRGSKMEDVIFSGTGERKAQGFAEVTLRLDNADGALNNPEPLVSVTRRFYRSGESAYMINGKAVRLRDVHELFMDTGLGRDGYSMVGQGKIEEMVSVKSENRREMFEEAAGISHLRYRRADALKRLDSAEENLVRLRDIVSELAARVGPLEKQSLKAQQFLVYAAERKDLEIGLWVNLLDKSSGLLREQTNRITVVEEQYNLTGQVLERLSSEIDAAAAGIRGINETIEQIRNDIAGLEEISASLESNAAVCDTTIEHNNDTMARLNSDKEAGEADDRDVLSQIDAAKEQIKLMQAENEVSRKKLDALTDELMGLKKSDDEYSGEYNAVSAGLTAISVKLSQAEVLISASQSSADEISARITAIESEQSEKFAEYDSLLSRKNEEEAELERIRAEETELRNSAGGYELKLYNASQKTEDRQKEYEEKRMTLLGKQQRLAFLDDTEKNMEGYQGSVKAVMRDVRRGILTGIRGTVFSLISVDSEYSTAIETALGNAIQDIVTETENDAKRAINMLKNENAGRATFLPINAVKGRVLDEKGLEDCFGFVGIASDLVRADSEYDEIVRSLLGRIAVADDLDTAIAIAKKYQYKFKIVTLDGQVINAGGSMTGGSKINSAGFLARRTEAEELRTLVEKLGKGLEEAENSLKLANELKASVGASLEGVKAELQMKTEARLTLEAALELTKSRLAENEKLTEGARTEKENAEKRREYFLESVRVGEKEKAELSAVREQKEKELAELSGGRDSLLAKRESINAEMTEVNLSIVSNVNGIDAKNEAIASLENRREAISQRRLRLDGEIAEIKEKNVSLIAEAEKIRCEAAVTRHNINSKNGEIASLGEKRASLEKASSDARGAEKEKTEEREKLSGEMARLEERKSALEKELADTERKLFEEYGLTRREAAQSAPEIESVPKANKRLSELKGLIKALGSVNVAAIDEYKEVSARYEFLSGQVTDVEKSKRELLRMIEELTTGMAETFAERFKQINEYFGQTFTQLFGGGKAELVLEDESNILECGIDIKAQPPGKNVKSLSLLSGGEKGLTAIALLFAILKVRPAPFCIFDEVEAALDDVNVLRYAQYVRSLTSETQFILITHRRGTMEEADILYGVTMQERGVSKLLELKTAEMVEKLKLDE